MFSKTAKYYDDIYGSFKDYRAEVRLTRRLIREHGISKGKRLLDVGCGTGVHAGLLSKYYQVEGLDLDAKMLAVARRDHPGLHFHQADMTEFQLFHAFDIITCLFSSIGYVRTRTRLRKAMRSMAEHLAPNGLILVEPWFTPGQWTTGRVGMITVEKPGHKIVRLSRSARQRKISRIEFEYLIATPRRIQHFTEVHELGLFTKQEYLDAFRLAGLKVTYDPQGLDGRGLYIGTKKP
jgi:SAM-dependent methyltransferase